MTFSPENDGAAEAIPARAAADIPTDILAQLRAAAGAARAGSYSPYSKFPVGAAARVDDGRTVVGTNVENASYGLTLCAECGLVSALAASGGGALTHFSCVDGEDNILMPCGRCRQLLFEFGGPGLIVDHPEGPTTLGALLPSAFGPATLAASRDPR